MNQRRNEMNLNSNFTRDLFEKERVTCPERAVTQKLKLQRSLRVRTFWMATRSRTLLFLQYRNTLARSSHRAGAVTSSYQADAETAGLIDSSDMVIEMSTLPPKWYVHRLYYVLACDYKNWLRNNFAKLSKPNLFRVDIVDEVEEDIKEIKEKSRLGARYSSWYECYAICAKRYLKSQ